MNKFLKPSPLLVQVGSEEIESIVGFVSIPGSCFMPLSMLNWRAS